MEDEVKTPETPQEPQSQVTQEPQQDPEVSSEATPEATSEAAPEAEAPAAPDPLQEAKDALQKEHDQYLRLAAEYDNFRKRTQKEKDNIYRDAKADTTEKFLPVFDNLSRALEQETADLAYKKGVEMTMTGLLEILKKLDVTIYGEPGDTFSPELHNAVMHLDDDRYKEGEIVQVFQKGFKLGDKVIRFAMVQTAN
jgi:molecular chaperone GrpE